MGSGATGNGWVGGGVACLGRAVGVAQVAWRGWVAWRGREARSGWRSGVGGNAVEVAALRRGRRRLGWRPATARTTVMGLAACGVACVEVGQTQGSDNGMASVLSGRLRGRERQVRGKRVGGGMGREREGGGVKGGWVEESGVFEFERAA
ncbi:hypothetical protein EDB84DRAFT_1447283 [Lactarius hengduanensis]|nr:hypothetical protein EDB84DRAFT_1447283 [Lactarius hengduanensis]